MTPSNLNKATLHSQILTDDPNKAFGDKTEDNMFNTRTGEIPGFEIDMHNDEPIIMGEVTMDSSSESGNDGEETEEDRQYMREALKKMDSRVQVKSFAQLKQGFYDNTLQLSENEIQSQTNEVMGFRERNAHHFSSDFEKFQEQMSEQAFIQK